MPKAKRCSGRPTLKLLGEKPSSPPGRTKHMNPTPQRETDSPDNKELALEAYIAQLDSEHSFATRSESPDRVRTLQNTLDFLHGTADRDKAIDAMQFLMNRVLVLRTDKPNGATQREADTIVTAIQAAKAKFYSK